LQKYRKYNPPPVEEKEDKSTGRKLIDEIWENLERKRKEGHFSK
jgi:hypothetical protein